MCASVHTLTTPLLAVPYYPLPPWAIPPPRGICGPITPNLGQYPHMGHFYPQPRPFLAPTPAPLRQSSLRHGSRTKRQPHHRIGPPLRDFLSWMGFVTIWTKSCVRKTCETAQLPELCASESCGWKDKHLKNSRETDCSEIFGLQRNCPSQNTCHTRSLFMQGASSLTKFIFGLEVVICLWDSSTFRKSCTRRGEEIVLYLTVKSAAILLPLV